MYFYFGLCYENIDVTYSDQINCWSWLQDQFELLFCLALSGCCLAWQNLEGDGPIDEREHAWVSEVPAKESMAMGDNWDRCSFWALIRLLRQMLISVRIYTSSPSFRDQLW